LDGYENHDVATLGDECRAKIEHAWKRASGGTPTHGIQTEGTHRRRTATAVTPDATPQATCSHLQRPDGHHIQTPRWAINQSTELAATTAMNTSANTEVESKPVRPTRDQATPRAARG